MFVAAVFLEDLIAVGGVGVAATGIGLSAVTGNSMYDAAGSITIGLLMGGVSLFFSGSDDYSSGRRRVCGGAVLVCSWPPPRRTRVSSSTHVGLFWCVMFV